MRVLKFLATGAIGISVNLLVFHLLHIFGAAYLVGSIAGFLVAVFVGFVLQKYWTFDDRSPERSRTQFVQYVILALFNLVINTGIVYVLIGRLNVYYLAAQAIGAALVAIDSYLFYRFFIFT
jgi:putative flippase GtrA